MKELLCPAGDMECLKAAVLNGADAVYLGGLKYGARAYSKNFSKDDLIEAVNFCHLYGVKLYVTVNTEIYQSEIEEVLKYVLFLHQIGVDALIVQDIGLINIIRHKYPNMEIHASTQVHTSNEKTIKFLEKLGVSRIVMAREVSLDDINKIETNLEIEDFIHGALCVSYSGRCLASHYIFNRSANRGECAGICRLKFKNEKDEEDYYLSCKELNTGLSFKEIMDSKIYSLKIEGRMKSPEYVGCVTRYYRDLMDKYYNHMDVIPNQELLNDLTIIYNRMFTKGFILNEKNTINQSSSNHLGLKIGNIIKTDRNYIYVKLISDIYQGDGIRFKDTNEGFIANYLYDENKKLINKASNIVLFKNTFKVKKGDIYKTSSVILKDKYTKDIIKKVKINMEFNCYYNYMELNIDDGINKVSSSSNHVFESKTIEVNEEYIYNQLKKLGESIYEINHFKCNIDHNLFVNKKDLNELRNNAISKLNEERIKNKKEVIINEYNEENKKINNSINYSILVKNEEMLNYVINDFDRIYVDDYNLYLKYIDNNKVYFKHNISLENRNIKQGLVSSYGDLNNNSIGDYHLNITNSYTLNYLNDISKLNTLSVELSDDEIELITKINNNFELVVYSHLDLMLIKNDISANRLKFNNDEFAIEKIDDISHLININPFNKLDNLDYYKKLGIKNFRIELYNENKEEIERIKAKLLR